MWLRNSLKLIVGAVILFWLASPIPEVAIAVSFIASTSLTDIPIGYAVPVSIVLAYIFKEMIDRTGIESKIEEEIGKIREKEET